MRIEIYYLYRSLNFGTTIRIVLIIISGSASRTRLLPTPSYINHLIDCENRRKLVKNNNKRD